MENVTMMLNSKLKSAVGEPNSAATTNTMEPFQDGGPASAPPNANNMDRTGPNHDFMGPVDGPQVNSEPNSFPVSMGGQGMGPDGFGKMSDGVPMPGYNSGFNRANFMGDQQHGGLGSGGSSSGPGDFPVQQNSQYPPYSHQSMRPGFPQTSRQGPVPGRPPMAGGNMNMMPPNYNNPGQPPRLMSGASIQQQGGPTPTLNQLLQNSNPGQRYPSGGYGDYGMGQKGVPEMPPNPGYTSAQNWGPGGQQRPVSPYQQHMGGSQPYRNQMKSGKTSDAVKSEGQMYEPPGRRTGSLGPNYPPSSGSGGQYMGPGQFSPNAQRYPGPMPGSRPMHPQPYGQQQMPPQYSNNQLSGPMGGIVGQQNQQSPYMSQQQQQPPQQQQQPSPHPVSQPSPQPPQPSQQQKGPASQSSQSSSSPSQGPSQSPGPGQPSPSPQQPQQKSQEPSPSPVNSQPHPSPQDAAHTPSSTTSNPDENSGDLNARSTPTSSQGPSHPAISALRPTPSPGGSAGSRSNTPASLTGNQAGSPMPPRPPSAHMEGNLRIQSPMPNQGYGPQMMPPPMGPNHAVYNSKMHSNMAGSPPMGYNNSHYPGQGQGGYPQNRVGMPGYNSPGNFGSNSPMGGGGQMYGSNSPGAMPGMNRSMSNSNYPNSYSPQAGGAMGAMNSQYGNYNSQSGAVPPNQSMPAQGPMTGPGTANINSMPSQINSSTNMPAMPSQPALQGPHGPKGAQAAAHAAVLAAANSASRAGYRASGQTSPGPGSGPSPAPGPVPGPGQVHMPTPGPPGPGSAGGVGHPMGNTPRGFANQFPGQQMNYNSMSQAPGPGNNGMGHGPHGAMDSMIPGPNPTSSMSSYNSMGPSSMNMNSIPPNQEISSSHPGMTPNAMGIMSSNMGHGTMGPTPSSNSGMGHPGMTPANMGPPGHTSSSVPGPGIPPNSGVPSSVSSSQPMVSGASSSMGPPTTPSSMPGVPSQPGSGGNNMPASSVQISPDVEDRNAMCTANSTAGNSGTSVTQSITGPVTNSTEDPGTPTPPADSSTPTPIPTSNNPNIIPAPNLQNQSSQSSDSSLQSHPSLPPPPKPPTPSQENSNSNSSFPQLEDPHLEKLRRENVSHPPTPVAPSPSASMSSVHDEFENISSPSWPGTPSQKVVGSDTISRMCEMGDEPDRRMFLDKLFAFMDERGTPITAMPCISKQPIDLYRLYVMVKEKGGLLEVTKTKKWRDICSALNCGSSGSAGFTLRKNYIKLLFNFECKFDRGGIDPMPVLAQIEAMSDKKTKKSNSNQQNNHQGPPVDPFRPPSNQPYEGFGPGGHPGGQRPYMGTPDMAAPPNQMLPPNTNMMHNNMPYDGPMMNNMPPNANMPNTGQMMPSANMPNSMGMPNTGMGNNMGMPNSSMPSGMGMATSSMSGGQMISRNMPTGGQESINVQDPFADEATMGSAGYQQRPSMNSQMPPYSSGMQNNLSNTFPSYNRPGPGMGSGTPGSNYQGMNQPGSYNDSMVQRPNQPSEQFNDPYRRGMIGNENFPNRSMSNHPPSQPQSQDSYTSGGSQFSGNRPMGSAGNNQFPFGSQYESNQSGSPMIGPGPQQPMRPPSQPGMNQGHQDPMYPRSYSGPQQMPRPSTPQDQFPQPGYPSQASGQSPHQPQGQSYPTPRPFSQSQDQFPHHASQPTVQGSGQGVYQKPAMPFGPKGYTRDGYNMPPSDIRTGQSWSPMAAGKYPGASGSTGMGFTPGSGMNQHLSPSMPSSPYFNRGSQQRISPHHRQPSDKVGGYSPQKMPKHMPQAFSQKKDIVFPPDSVEAVQPLLNKRRRHTAKDIPAMEAWRLMMALKSGLLAESTWALDTLSILLFDDSTVTYFNMQHLPGLVEVLLSHWRKCLTVVFGGHDELEITAEKRKALEARNAALLENREIEGEEESLGALFARHRTDMEKLNQPNNFTLKTRKGKPIKMEKDSEDANIIFDGKEWDIYSGFVSNAKVWDLGKGDLTDQVLTHFMDSGSQDFFRSQFFGCRHAEAKDKCKKAASIEQPSGQKDQDSCTDTIANEESSCESTKLGTCEPVIKLESGTESLPANDCSKAEPMCCSNPSKESSVPGSSSDAVTENSSSTGGCSTDLKTPSSPCINVKTEPVDTDLSKPVQTSGECIKVEPESSGEGSADSAMSTVKDEAAGTENASKSDIENSRPEVAILDKESDPGAIALESLKRKWAELEEGEAYQHDYPPLSLISNSQEELSRRCICISNIFRSLSFVPGNDVELSKHRGLLLVLGRLLTLHHTHPKRRRENRRFERDELDIQLEEDAVEEQRREWWWDTLEALRENTLVILANIAGQLNLASVPEPICLPLLDGLLHWAVCPAACAQDPMSTMSPNSVLSAQRLVLEALCKLCVQEENVDLLLATPPFSRIVQLLANLVKLLANRKEQVLREFAIVLLSSLVQGESSAARAVALQHPAISLLVDFLETAESQAMQIASSHGVDMLRDNPEMMGTSLDMLRRAATTLLHLAMVPENRPLFLHMQHRLLQLVMSQILDQNVASIVADVLYQCSQAPSLAPSS